MATVVSLCSDNPRYISDREYAVVWWTIKELCCMIDLAAESKPAIQMNIVWPPQYCDPMT